MPYDGRKMVDEILDASRKPRKNDLVCAFHEDFEADICRMQKRIDVLILITVVNALLAGSHLGWKFLSLF